MQHLHLILMIANGVKCMTVPVVSVSVGGTLVNDYVDISKIYERSLAIFYNTKI